MAAVTVVPAGGTYLDTFKKSFVDVPVDAAKDNAIATSDFLEAAEALTTMFGRNTQSRRSKPIPDLLD